MAQLYRQSEHRSSRDSLNPRMSRSGSLENMLDGHSPRTRQKAMLAVPSPGKSHDCQRQKSKEAQNERPMSQRVGSLRYSRIHGSLDSLIDLLDRQEKRASWASSDSEDGSDFLTSITTTFDQKLQILLNPKYKLTGSKRGKADTSGSSSTHSESTEDRDDNSGKQIKSHNSSVLSDFGWDRTYQDPSLHRSAKTVGIASRFERGSGLRASSSSPVMNSSSNYDNVYSAISQSRKAQFPDFRAFLYKSDKDSSSPVSLTQPKKLDGLRGSKMDSRALAKSGNKADPRPISKSEKTEVNSTLARLSREEKFLLGSKDADRKSSADTVLSGSATDKNKRDKRRSQRRHTVGGTKDFEHFKALVNVTSAERSDNISRPTAWEQLQPAVKEGGSPGGRNLLTWIQNERLRGSTPDLTAQDQKNLEQTRNN